MLGAPNNNTSAARNSVFNSAFPATLPPMHWLQTLDTNLFLFVNRSLANPFFDWLMPILSGSNGVKKEFIAVAIAVGFAMLGFGKSSARLCVLLLALIVGTN